MAKPLTAGEEIARDLCEMDAPIDNVIEVNPVDVARRIDERIVFLLNQLSDCEFRNERLVANYAEVQEENDALRRIHAENLAIKDAEIARWKTIPMKYRRMEFNAQLQDEANELRQQLAALKAELREICAAIDDPASDLTLTTVECIKKLKAESEALRRDAERWRKIEQQWSSAEIRNNLDGSFKSMTITFEAPKLSDELNMEKLRRDFDAAMPQGEK